MREVPVFRSGVSVMIGLDEYLEPTMSSRSDFELLFDVEDFHPVFQGRLTDSDLNSLVPVLGSSLLAFSEVAHSLGKPPDGIQVVVTPDSAKQLFLDAHEDPSPSLLPTEPNDCQLTLRGLVVLGRPGSPRQRGTVLLPNYPRLPEKTEGEHYISAVGVNRVQRGALGQHKSTSGKWGDANDLATNLARAETAPPTTLVLFDDFNRHSSPIGQSDDRLLFSFFAQWNVKEEDGYPIGHQGLFPMISDITISNRLKKDTGEGVLGDGADFPELPELLAGAPVRMIGPEGVIKQVKAKRPTSNPIEWLDSGSDLTPRIDTSPKLR